MRMNVFQPYLRGISIVLALIVWDGMSLANDEAIPLYYTDRAPHHVLHNGKVTGIAADRTNAAFEKAGIPYKWVVLPSKRQLLEIKLNEEAVCSPSWFWREERAAYGLYTKAIYKNKPQGIIGLISNDILYEHKTLKSLFQDKRLTAVINTGFSYGSYFDDLLANAGNTPMVVSLENKKILRLIYYNRADFMIIAPEEAKYLLDNSVPELKSTLSLFNHYTDAPRGEKRYIICSKKVGQDTIDKLDAAITVLFEYD